MIMVYCCDLISYEYRVVNGIILSCIDKYLSASFNVDNNRFVIINVSLNTYKPMYYKVPFYK